MQPQNQPPHNHYHRDYHIRDPPPYPGYRQSYSGSEASTDISLSSTENLSTSARQEPQGEETTNVVLGPLDPATGEGDYDLLSRLALQSTQAVEIKSANSSTFYVTGSMPNSTMSVSSNQELNLSGSSGYASQVPTPTPTPTPVTQYQKTSGTSLIPQANNVVYSSSPLMGSQMLQHGNHYYSLQAMARQNQQMQMQNYLQQQQQQTNQELQDPNSMYLGQTALPTSCNTTSPSQITQQNLEEFQRQQSMLSQYLEHQKQQPAYQVVTTSQMHQLQSQQQPRQTQSPQMSQNQVKSLPGSITFKNLQSSPASKSLPRQLDTAVTTTSLAMDSVRSLTPNSQTAVKQLMSSPLSKPSERVTDRPRPSTAPCSGRRHAPPPLPLPPGDFAGLSGAKLQKASQNQNQALEENKKELRRSYEQLDKLQLTRSQPDLTRLAELTTTAISQGQLVTSSSGSSCLSSSPQPVTQSITNHLDYQTDYDLQTDSRPGTPILSQRQLTELDHAAIATRATQMVERLSEENRSLRQELEGYYNKVCKLQKFELEIQKVHDAHEALVKHSSKRENLEKVMRFKLEAEIKKLKDTNKDISEQYHQALQHIQQHDTYNMTDSDLKNELLRKDAMISKLITHNRDITGVKERLEIELVAQRSTLDEHRNHIDILDSALSNAQASVAQYDEEIQRRKREEEKVQDLQQVLTQLKMAVDKREQKEQDVRSRLEDEIRLLKAHHSGASSISKISDTDEGISSDSESTTSLQSLIRQMQLKEERILKLEAEVAKWEQKYLEEAAIRQIAVDAASVPKDVRIAALEQNSMATGKMIAEARTEKLKHLEEVYQANRKVAEMEAKLKTLQAQLAEKDAMLKVLQRHSSLSRTSSVSSLFASPLHSPRTSLMSSPLALSLCSSALSTPGASASSSRQNSQIDTSPYCREAAKPPIHSKSNFLSITDSTGNTKCSPSKDAQIRELQQKLVAAQAALFNTLQSSQDGSDLKKCFWQV